GNPKLTLSDDKKWFDISYTVAEGVPFTVKKIEIQGNKIYPTDQIRSQLKTKENELFRRNILRQDLAAITDLYGEKGYIYANVIPQFSPNQDARTVNLLLEINEDNQIQVRQINISGNEKTRDKVIRREIKIDEQDVMNTKG